MSMESIPPNEDAFLQHCKRAIYQAGVWSISDMANVRIPCPQGFGWTLHKGKPEMPPPRVDNPSSGFKSVYRVIEM